MDTRCHWALVKLALQQVVDPGNSIFYNSGVRFLANVRVGYSHKFHLINYGRAIIMNESPLTDWGFPHGDIMEGTGWKKGDRSDGLFGTSSWFMPREVVFPLKKTLVNGLLVWGPRDPRKYVDNYLLTMYGNRDDWQATCRGHRSTVTEIVNCSSMDGAGASGPNPRPTTWAPTSDPP